MELYWFLWPIFFNVRMTNIDRTSKRSISGSRRASEELKGGCATGHRGHRGHTGHRGHKGWRGHRAEWLGQQFYAFMTFTGMSYLISLNPLHFKNITHVGSFEHFVFLYSWPSWHTGMSSLISLNGKSEKSGLGGLHYKTRINIRDPVAANNNLEDAQTNKVWFQKTWAKKKLWWPTCWPSCPPSCWPTCPPSCRPPCSLPCRPPCPLPCRPPQCHPDALWGLRDAGNPKVSPIHQPTDIRTDWGRC